MQEPEREGPALETVRVKEPERTRRRVSMGREEEEAVEEEEEEEEEWWT